MKDNCQKIVNKKEKSTMSFFKDKTLMITGGTGSFGNAVLNRFLQTDIGEIRFFLEMRRNRIICTMNFK